jgi:hypothetical protein
VGERPISGEGYEEGIRVDQQVHTNLGLISEYGKSTVKETKGGHGTLYFSLSFRGSVQSKLNGDNLSPPAAT